ncbi:MAG: hypothetical protein JNK75_09100 [Betaproteobacteria bacterium]|nr:hypothetical protein [Betaproteobacteria bacterium]
MSALALPLPSATPASASRPAEEPVTRRLARRFGHGHPAARLVRAVLALACLAAALVLLGFLYFKSTSADPTVRAEVESALRAIRQDDTDWSAEVLRTKLGIAEDYDAIVALDRGVRARIARLATHPAAADPAFRTSLGALDGAFRHKAERSDRFKSHNSILRNSLRYLPTAAAEARAALSGVAGNTAREADALLAHALTESLKYAVVADESHRAGMQEAIERLQARTAALPAGDARDAAGVFLVHAHTVLRFKRDEEALLAAVTQAPTVRNLDLAIKTFESGAAFAASAADFWRTLLALYCGALLALAAAFAWRLRGSYVALNRANSALSAANDGLEARVLERTRELEAALKSLKESESQLVQSEKMSSLGQMVAGVAHEINTPLAYVRSNLEVLAERAGVSAAIAAHAAELVTRLAHPDREPEALNACFQTLARLTQSSSADGTADELGRLAHDGLHGIAQISDIVTNLKNFSRLDLSKTTWFDVRDGLDSTLVIARNVVKSHHVVKEFTEVPKIECSPSQLNQVFLNLITNAAQALPAAGGILTLRTRAEGKEVRIEVSDNGKGIAPEHLPRIFDPFFTTKPVGEGTGLGLSIAYKIVNAHGGRIAVDSTPGCGTTFSVFLPAQGLQRKAAARRPSRVAAAPSQRTAAAPIPREAPASLLA